MRTLEARPFVSTPSTVAALVGGFTANTGIIPAQTAGLYCAARTTANIRQSTIGYASFPTHCHVLMYMWTHATDIQYLLYCRWLHTRVCLAAERPSRPSSCHCGNKMSLERAGCLQQPRMLQPDPATMHCRGRLIPNEDIVNKLQRENRILSCLKAHQGRSRTRTSLVITALSMEQIIRFARGATMARQSHAKTRRFIAYLPEPPICPI
jgi:hypothetical protein